MQRLVPPFWMDGGSAQLFAWHRRARPRHPQLRLSIGGARTSLVVALIGLVIGGGIGGTVGIVAGYFFGGLVDDLIMRLADARR